MSVIGLAVQILLVLLLVRLTALATKLENVMTEISSNPPAIEESSLAFFKPSEYEIDTRSAAKLRDLRYYNKPELMRRLDGITGFLVDCQHKNWSGVLKELTYTLVDLTGEPVIGDAAATKVAPAIIIEFVPKEGEVFTLTTKLEGSSTLLERARRIYTTVIAGLDKAAEEVKGIEL